MTAILRASINGSSFLIGDILLSYEGSEPVHEAKTLPLSNVKSNERPIKNNTYWVTGFTQKLILLSQNCIVAWAGDEWDAKVAVQNIRREINSKGLEGIGDF